MTRLQSFLIETRAGRVCLAVISFLLPILAAMFVLVLTGCAHGANWHAAANDTLKETREEITAPQGAIVAHSEPTISAAAPVKILRTTRETTRDRDSADSPKTGKQIASQIVGGSLGLGTVGVILLAVFCPSTLAAFAIKSLFKWRTAFRETVAGVETWKDTADTGTVSQLKQNLQAAQSVKTRQLVTTTKGSV